MRMETHERSKSGSQGLTLCGWGEIKGQNPAEALADGQTKVVRAREKFFFGFLCFFFEEENAFINHMKLT